MNSQLAIEVRGLVHRYGQRVALDRLELAVAAAREENARLREEARRLREDPAAIEDIARRELGLIKPGETLFVVRDVAPAEPR